jgi:glycosyltransferase involved in cell wall biosynthesis
MLFSIIIPVFNTDKYLKACLDSIAAQAFDDFEVILVDDGSTDSSGRMCDEFCNKFNGRAGRTARAKVIHQENRGLSGARNRGIEEAAGDWLWFIDSDDFISSDALETICERMRFAKGDLYAFQYIKTDENGSDPEYIFFRESQENVRIKNEGDYIWHSTERLLQYKDGWEAWSRLFNRSIIRTNGLSFKDTKQVFAEDICFLLEYLMCAKNTVFLVNYLYYYRQRINSIMGTLDQKTVIPRIINLLEDVYTEAKRFKKKQVIKEFDRICRAAISNQILYKLDELPDEEICAGIMSGQTNKAVGKYIKKVSEGLIQEAKGDRRRRQ